MLKNLFIDCTPEQSSVKGALYNSQFLSDTNDLPSFINGPKDRIDDIKLYACYLYLVDHHNYNMDKYLAILKTNSPEDEIKNSGFDLECTIQDLPNFEAVVIVPFVYISYETEINLLKLTFGEYIDKIVQIKTLYEQYS